jgi:crotonobetainyl-CoA:carnitine CoA-transferase CaiB-like acyl-CoA transferase
MAGRHSAHEWIEFFEVARGVELPRWVTRSAPRLGEHNEDVLSTLLGLTDAAIAALGASAVIGHTPLASNPSFNM